MRASSFSMALAVLDAFLTRRRVSRSELDSSDDCDGSGTRCFFRDTLFLGDSMTTRDCFSSDAVVDFVSSPRCVFRCSWYARNRFPASILRSFCFSVGGSGVPPMPRIDRWRLLRRRLGVKNALDIVEGGWGGVSAGIGSVSCSPIGLLFTYRHKKCSKLVSLFCTPVNRASWTRASSFATNRLTSL